MGYDRKLVQHRNRASNRCVAQLARPFPRIVRILTWRLPRFDRRHPIMADFHKTDGNSADNRMHDGFLVCVDSALVGGILPSVEERWSII